MQWSVASPCRRSATVDCDSFCAGNNVLFYKYVPHSAIIKPSVVTLHMHYFKSRTLYIYFTKTAVAISLKISCRFASSIRLKFKIPSFRKSNDHFPENLSKKWSFPKFLSRQNPQSAARDFLCFHKRASQAKRALATWQPSFIRMTFPQLLFSFISRKCLKSTCLSKSFAYREKLKLRLEVKLLYFISFSIFP